MTSALCVTTDVDLKQYHPCDTSPILEEVYATVPMPVIKPAYQSFDEESLHTSFEEALSDRVLAVQSRLSRLSNAHTQVRTSVRTKRNNKLVLAAWQRSVIFVSLALMFMLIGFDIMGLLVLHLH